MPKIGEVCRVQEVASDDYDDTPPELRGYKAHGLEMRYRRNSIEATADCPFCGREKMYINTTNSLYDCKTCGVKGGNFTTFMRRLHEESLAELTADDARELCEHRGFTDPSVVQEWGVCKSLLTTEWLVPGYSSTGSLNQLYRYVTEHDGSSRLYATPDVSHTLLGLHLWDKSKPTVIICEGVWDAMALWEVLGKCKQFMDSDGNDTLTFTSNLTTSLLGGTNVIAVPGCPVWNDSWLPLFKGKRVILAYDSDHPKPIKNTNKMAPPVGCEGMKRVAASLIHSNEPPASVEWIAWGKDGYDPSLPSGMDIRDHLKTAHTIRDRIPIVQSLWQKIEPVPKEWSETGYVKSADGTVELSPLKCEKWSILLDSYKKAYEWLPGMEHGLSCMLAVIASTESVGDQLWIRLIGVPGSGKTRLAEALSANRKYVRGSSTMKGFFSGYQTDSDGKEDNSLLAKINNKTLITKDGDTLLKSPDRERILSEARDVYDRVARPDYRNKTSREYPHLSVTWILCGTPSLRELDSSDLGARFIDVIVMEFIDKDHERKVMLRVIEDAFNSTSVKCNGTASSQDLPRNVEAKRLTSGYINYLRENAQGIADAIKQKVSSDVKIRVYDLARFVSFMRARPSDKVETLERELPSRLGSQLSRLAMFLAVVMNKDDVDDDVMNRVSQVAIDTGKGKTLDIARHLYEQQDNEEISLDYKSVATLIARNEDQTLSYLQFLTRIRAVDAVKIKRYGVYRTEYRLTTELRRLYRSVILNV